MDAILEPAAITGGHAQPRIRDLYRGLYADYLQLGSPNTLSFSSEGEEAPTFRPTVYSHLVDVSSSETASLDPGTIELILAGASLLLDLFGGPDYEDVERELERIGEWIEKVDGQLHRMNRLLEDIRQKLARLDVLLDAAFTRDAEYEVIGRCQAYVTNLPGLRANAASSTTRDALIAMYTGLQPAVRKLMHYGYAPAYTVFYALRIEADLARALQFGRGTETSIAREYADYFDAALDEVVVRSIPNNIRSREVAMQDHATRYTAGAKGFAGTWWYWDNQREHCYGGRGERECITVRDDWRYHPGVVITGAIESGFDGYAADVGHVYAERDRGQHHYLRGRQAALAAATQHVRENVLPEYSHAATEYAAWRSEVVALDMARESCQQFRQVAQKLAE